MNQAYKKNDVVFVVILYLKLETGPPRSIGVKKKPDIKIQIRPGSFIRET